MTTWQALRTELQSDDFQKPHHAANQVLRRMGVELPPVPVEHIVQNLGIVVVKHDNLDAVCVTETFRTKQRPRITVRASEKPTRQRFALAHALAHVLRHARGNTYIDHGYSPSTCWDENDANEFAVSLLCPLWMLEPIVTGSKRSAEELARLFQIPTNTLLVQLEQLA